jgi:hypothetical protein
MPIATLSQNADYNSLTDGQKLVYQGVLTGDNILITGGGGVGKSHLIRFLSENIRDLVLTASTGIAALNICGQTLDSFMGFNQHVTDIQSARKINPQTRHKLSKLKILLIDEVSMIRCDKLDMVDARLKAVMKNDMPFGGVQVIFVGDFCQLAPVVQDGSDEALALRAAYGNRVFAFEAKSYQNANIKTFVLFEYVRQDNEAQKEILRHLRLGKEVDKCVEYINQLATGQETPNALRICKTNRKVSQINEVKFNQLQGDIFTFIADVENDFKPSMAPVPAVINLKINTRVLLCANNQSANYFNGDLGTIVGFTSNAVKVKLDRGGYAHVEAFEFKSYAYTGKEKGLEKEHVGSFKQIPIKLGYAITAHKSQGMTLDEAVVDLGGNFNADGLTYVVMSRVRSFKGLKLARPLTMRDVQTSKKAVDFTYYVSTRAMERSKLELSLVRLASAA